MLLLEILIRNQKGHLLVKHIRYLRWDQYVSNKKIYDNIITDLYILFPKVCVVRYIK